MKEYFKEFPKYPHRLFVLIGLTVAILFVIFSSIRLSSQGLYYDEVSQAPASFAYIGIDSEKVCSLTIQGIPLLNMKYSGAIKTAIYGLYLKYFGPHFSIISWRLVGIIFVSTGIFLFCIIAGPRMLLFSLLIFLFLFVTDLTVILTTRHDWGPVAFALLLRLLFIAIWIHGESKNSTTKINTFFLGFLVGIAIYEKLSSVVLIFPLVLMFLFSVNRRSLGHFVICVIGLIIGGIPLIFVNIYTFLDNGTLISLVPAAKSHQINFSELPGYFTNYISLGNGALVKSFILGIKTNNLYINLEKVFISIILLITAIMVICYWKHNKLFRISGVMLLSYITVGIAIYLLPASTWIHHWIIGTPFQYIAISFSLVGIYYHVKDSVSSRLLLFRVIFTAIIIVIMTTRLISFVSLERSFFRGDTSLTWDPSLSKIGYFASNRTNEAIFIAADWGIAAQIYCLSGGYPDLVHQLFNSYKGPEQIKAIINKTGRNIMYVVFKHPKTKVSPDNTERILQDINKLPHWLPDWNEAPVENEIEKLKAVTVRKFVHIEK